MSMDTTKLELLWSRAKKAVGATGREESAVKTAAGYIQLTLVFSVLPVSTVLMVLLSILCAHAAALFFQAFYLIGVFASTFVLRAFCQEFSLDFDQISTWYYRSVILLTLLVTAKVHAVVWLVAIIAVAAIAAYGLNKTKKATKTDEKETKPEEEKDQATETVTVKKPRRPRKPKTTQTNPKD